MKVSPEEPFEIVYSLFEHEYLGYLFESFAIQLNEKGNLTYSHQNISSKNAAEFDENMDEADYQLIKLMDEIQQERVSIHFQKKKLLKPQAFFLKTYHEVNGDQMLQKEIGSYIERRRAGILALMAGKKLYEMGKDGEPTWKKITVSETKATILFHFRKNEDNTHYFPTIKLNDEKVEFRDNESYLLCKEPAWMVSNNTLFTFEKNVSGGKIKPFLNKKFILIQKDMEETYYQKFVAPLIAEFDVYAKGFEIRTERSEPKPKLLLSDVQTSRATTLFDDDNQASNEVEKVLMELSFNYGTYNFQADKLNKVSVSLEKVKDEYIFHRISRNTEREKEIIGDLEQSGLAIRNSRVTLTKSKAFDWLNTQKQLLKDFDLHQVQTGKKYFLGESTIDLEVSEGVDWFDLQAKIKFGEFEIPFAVVRQHILKEKTEIELPNGEYGVIPESWIIRYKDLFAFSNSHEGNVTLNKIHLSLVRELKDGDLAKVVVSRKLEQLLDFDQIEEFKTPESFIGDLRPYQLAGYNWMRFLEEYNFGGCLADDMGLGKTIQALSLLQHEKNISPESTSLLVMPTSLLYNWEMEAKKFTPELKILNYTGINREKDAKNFAKYDLVLTSYGTTRIDAEILAEFYFNYVILDESQAIKNPDSLISKKVRQLNSRRRLILTGTPIENSTLDIWSQMSFLNPGLLGNESYFRKQYLIPIEKRKDVGRIQKLNALIKPFILRRDKGQVADDLPEKVVNIRYCTMSDDQREVYEEEKNAFRSRILDVIETDGVAKSHIMLLQGLTHLRQVANHPKMINPEYEGSSGKLEEVTYMIENSLSKGHKVLIFSQFVKHLKIVSDYLEKQELKFAYLDGSTKDRKGQVELFQNNDEYSIFLISLKAGGVGLNLTKADYVFLLDPWWNPAVEAQAIDRAHRIGQKQTVFAYKYITKDTIEEKILKLQEHKQKLASELIAVEESFVKSLSKIDIQKLFD